MEGSEVLASERGEGGRSCSLFSSDLGRYKPVAVEGKESREKEEEARSCRGLGRRRREGQRWSWERGRRASPTGSFCCDHHERKMKIK